MKKLFVIALAAFGMVACVNEEITELPQGGAITFESAFIDNATRAAIDPSITTASLAGFNVWGFVKEYDGTIFNAVDVKKVGGVWGYEGTQYWVPNQPYYFAALAPMDSANWSVEKATGDAAKLGLGTITFKNVDGSEDLLYAKEMMQSKSTVAEENGPVKFQFQHLLSKVKFTFKNGFPTETASIKVTNVKMTAPKSAEINLAQADYSKAWTAHANTTTLVFGDVEKLAYTQSAEVANERLTIPAADYTYTITFDVELFMGAQSVYTVEKTSTVTGYELAMGYAYNFTAEITPENLNLEAIEFEVEEVEDWVNGGNINATPAALVNGQPYETFEEAWTAAVDGNSELELNDNVTIDADNTLVLGNGMTGTLDLNGKTLTVLSNDDTDTRAAKSGNREMFLVKGGTLNVKGGTIVYKHTGANMGWGAMTTVFDITAGGVVNIEDATIKNLGGTDMNFVAHLNNWGEATLNVDNSTLEAPYVAVRVFNSGPDKNNVSITNSTLKGGRCFWVHNWTVADFGSEEKAAAQQALIDYEAAVLNGTNTFEYTNAAVRLGFTNSIALDETGARFVSTAAELENALTAGVNCALAADITVDADVTLKVAVGKTVSINLNGKTISGTDNATGSYGLITNQGNLTIQGNGKLTVKATNNRNWNAYSSVISNTVGGKLTIEEGVVIEHLGGTDMAYGIDNLTNGKGTYAETVINGGTIKSTYRAVRQFLNGIEAQNILTVNGGVIEGANKSIWMQDPSANANTGKLTVTENAQLKGDVYLFVCAGSTEWPVEVSIAEAALVGESTILTGNVPAGYEVVLENGVYTVNHPTSVSTAEDFTKALSEGGNICLQNNLDITKLDFTNLTNDVVIDAKGKTITTHSNYGIQVKAGKNITLKNAKIEITVAGNYITYAAGLKVENGDYAGKTISLVNCEIRMCNTDWAYAVNMPASVKNLNLEIDGCTLEGALALQCWGDNNTITVTNSNLICNYTTNAMYTSYCVALQGDGTNNSENNTLNISGCAFSYSGVDNYNSTIRAVYNWSDAGNNTITVEDCTYDNKVTAY